MIRLLLAAALGAALGYAWPRPRQVAVPAPSRYAELDRTVDALTCDARVIEAWATGWAAERSGPCECGITDALRAAEGK